MTENYSSLNSSYFLFSHQINVNQEKVCFKSSISIVCHFQKVYIHYLWFPLDHNRIVKLCDPGKFWPRLQNFKTGIYDDLLGCKSEPISLRFLLSIVINLSELEPA